MALWLDFGQFVKLDKGVLEHGLVILFEGLDNDFGHGLNQMSEFFDVFALSSREQARHSLQSRKLNVKALMGERALEHLRQISFEFDQVVHDVAEQAIHDLEASIDTRLIVGAYELVGQIN